MQLEETTPAGVAAASDAVRSPNEEFVAYFSVRLRPTLIAAMEALALLKLASMSRRHKWHPNDRDVFSIPTRTIERSMPRHYKQFLLLTCERLPVEHVTGFATRAYRLMRGFDPERAHSDLARILEEKDARAKRASWRKLKSVGEQPKEPTSISCRESRSPNVFEVKPGMKWYDAALVAAAPARVKYFRTTGKRSGRRYNPLQCISREGKRISLEGTGLMDVDMVKCHPTILHHLTGCRSPALQEYISGSWSGKEKEDFIAVMNGRRRAKTMIGGKLLGEMQGLWKDLIASGHARLRQRESRSGMFEVLSGIEDRILQVIEASLKRLGKRVHLLMFDGLICDPVSDAHLSWIEAEVFIRSSVRMRLQVKQTF